MIWHYFKKDWKLLWPLVLIVAAIHIMNAALQSISGHFGGPHELAQIAGLFPLAVLLGIAVLIVTAVHQDAVPGDRQDWLVRPIHRRDLLLAKLLFVLVAVHGPILLVDMAQSMIAGFSFSASLSVALSRGILLMLNFSLPILALAAITSTIVEVVGSALAFFLIYAVFEIAVGGNAPYGMGWMGDLFCSAVALAAAFAVIPLQYFRRATMPARSIALAAVFLVPVPAFVPWAPAFAFQQWFSADPATAKAVAVVFDPNLGKLTLEPGGQTRANSVWLPLRVSGLPPDSIVINDHAEVRLIGRDGAILFHGPTTGDPQTTGAPRMGPLHIDDFPVRTTAGGEVRTHQFITLPGKIYELVRSQPVRMEMDYSLTLFHIEATDTIAALNGDKRIANFGWCKTKIDDDGDEVEIGCISTGDAPSCATLVLRNTVTGQRNPAYNRCPPVLLPDYAPYSAHFYPSALERFGGGLGFRDPQGLAKYPVDSAQLPNAQVLIKTYQPVAHFTRHLVIPEIHLGDWEADTGQIAANATQ